VSVELFANSGNARLWRLVAGVFLFAGCLALTERVWTLSADMHARKTWPSADGEILSATQQDDTDLARKAGSVRGRTRYWVEYEVGFAVPAAQCPTGIIYEGPAETLPCHGIVRTRSTQSTSQAFQWLLHGYHVHQPVKVLWNPAGTMSTDIKIAGESIWLRYNTDRLALSLLWVFAFGLLFAFSQSRVTYFKTHPEEEIWPHAELASESGNRPPTIY
jgi:hypothetical protein